MIIKNTSAEFLLIAPHWNWNRWSDINWVGFIYSFNRTTLELKRISRYPNLWTSLLLIAPHWNWNWFLNSSYNSVYILLIAPHWNWNMFEAHKCNPFTKTFNRTTLELKLVICSSLITSFSSFNRTTLELKPTLLHTLLNLIALLIAPHWNWNNRICFGVACKEPF